MVGSISNVSTLQVLRATQAFKNIGKSSSELPNELEINDNAVQSVLSQEAQRLNDNSKTESIKNEIPSVTKNSKYMNEIKEFMNKYGQTDINEEDFNYAIRYGKSILVDAAG